VYLQNETKCGVEVGLEYLLTLGFKPRGAHIYNVTPKKITGNYL
jgi:hypothetical protein